MRVLKKSQWFGVSFFSELLWGKATVVHTKPEKRRKEESNRLRGEGDQIKFIELRFEGKL